MAKDQEHWAKTEERGSSFGIKFLLYSFKYLGPLVCKVFMTPVLLYFYIFNGQARRNLKNYLTHVSQYFEGVTHASQRNVLKIFFNFGFGIVDRMSAWQGHVNKFKISKLNNQYFLELNKTNKGAVIMVSHLGNFEISRMASGANKNAVFNIFMHTKNAKKTTEAIKKFNPAYAVNFIQGDDLTMKVAIELKEKVDAGEFIVIGGDRVPVSNDKAVVTAKLLGRPAKFPIGPYVLAKVLNCPLLGIFCIKTTAGYQVTFETFAEEINFTKNNREEVIEAHLNKYIESIEQQLKLAPLQWYNFHDFWNQK